MKLSKTLACLLMALSLTACGTVGPKGDKGDPGTPGQTGPQGPQGPAGQDGADGQDGKDGVDGQDGKDGVDGLPGTDGATWLTGENDPSNDEGKNGDLYLNTLTFDIFLKTNGVWNKIGNIKGKDGTDGQDGKDGVNGQDGKDGTDGVNGQDGKDGVDGQDGKDGVDGLPGTDGATWLTGENDPSNDEGKNGDLYLNTTNFDIFTKVDGDWIKIGNIKGNPGENGHDAETYGVQYTVIFDALGGTLLDFDEQITVKYGETINLPLAEKDGFFFTGWYTGFTVNDGKFTNTTPVTKDMTLYAGWEAEQIYTIYFHSNEGSALEPMQFQNNYSIHSLPSSSKTDYTFNGWYYDESLNNRVSYPFIINKDLDLYAKWVDAYYDINFDTVGGSAISKQSHLAGTSINELPTPSKEYCSFAGWYLDSGYVTPVSLPFDIHESMTLYAKWNTTKSTIVFNSNGGSDVPNQEIVNGTYLTESSMPKPTRKSYTFAGWYKNATLTTAVTYPYLVNADATLYAKWTDNYSGYTKISTYSQLKSITNMSGKYVLINDINCGGQSLNQIGTASSPFSGIFDGAGYSISNFGITVDSSNLANCALFGSNNGSITDVRIDSEINFGNVNYNGVNCSGLVGNNSGTISKCSFVGLISITYKYGTGYLNVGGLCGTNTSAGQINNCVFNGSIIATNTASSVTEACRVRAAAISGYNQGTVSYCVNAGSVQSLNPNTSTGATSCSTYLSGITNYGAVSNCLNLKSASGSVIRFGSDIAYGATVNNCYKHSDVTIIGKTISELGTSASTYQVNSSSFYTSTLRFDSNIWNVSGLNFANGIYVSLK